ncbi:HVSL domain-containing protein [Aspergillus saccharolyticus JOP 1030-1]|uniref:U6 snRNA phosphodiesterase n=1 Tax=Aspergillus saccharolyticus JOP 1030-1 TaxID=1450539 RepID=A0A318ZJG6_9EURO|nr:hypothetical protein BP01DRAFT_354170 [Aspergillus saccharolyticus JOP 1030-1]PYH47656.1 hypothetical protein BP01DRAFT_354170 [Aspergillus saccharolyticus JOP 1030-1]
MVLVQYSESESESESESDSEPVHASQPPAKRLCTTKPSPTQQSLPLPPLPAAFHDLYASSTRVSVRDDPSLHGGRKRVIPHVEGNWPTHLYLEWYASKTELTLLSDVILQIQQKLLHGSKTELHSLLHSDLGAQLPLHISLSRPVVLRTEQRQPFLEAFQSAMEQSHCAPFDTTADSVDCVSNYEKTRWFYVLRVRSPEHDELNRLLKLSNRALARFGQPPLYEVAVPPSLSPRLGNDSAAKKTRVTKPAEENDYSHCFHVSLAWSLTEPSAAEKEQLATTDLHKLRDLKIGFDCVKVKIGNQIFSNSLA